MEFISQQPAQIKRKSTRMAEFSLDAKCLNNGILEECSKITFSPFFVQTFQIQLNKQGIHPKKMMGPFNSNRDQF